MKEKRFIFWLFLAGIMMAASVFGGCASNSNIPDPAIGTPNLIQQALNLLPAIPIAGNNLKFQFGGDTWIATVNGENFFAGTIEITYTNDGSILTLKQTHIWPGAVVKATGNVANVIPGGAAVGRVLNTAGKIAQTDGPVKASDLKIVLDYRKGPPSSLRLVSTSSNQKDSSSKRQDDFSARAIMTPINTAVRETINASLSAGTVNNISVVTAQNVGLNDSDFKVKVNRNSTITITNYKGNMRELVIPNTLNDRTVTHIGRNAFVNRELKSVVIPNSVIVIEQNAFRNNKSLREIRISDSVISIEKGAFENCDADMVILGKDLQIIKENAFKANKNLREITIPNSVICIEKGAFEENNIEKIVLGNNLKIIRENAFRANRRLKEITIPNSVICIEKGAFEENNLEKVVLGNSLKIIRENAFRTNRRLSEISIPDSVISIDAEAFANCGLTRINFGNSLEVIGEEAFMNNRINTVVLPEGISFVGSFSFGRNPIKSVVIPSSLAQNSFTSGFTDAFLERQDTVNLNITRITLPENVHLRNLRQFEGELVTFYQTNNAAGTFIRNAPLNVFRETERLGRWNKIE